MAGDCTAFCYRFNQFPLNQPLGFLKPYTVIFNTVIVCSLQENLKPAFDELNTARPEYEIFL